MAVLFEPSALVVAARHLIAHRREDLEARGADREGRLEADLVVSSGCAAVGEGGEAFL